nr:MAG TPA: Protein of unknown function (DUF551) [Caudoviricetes sp.]
MTIDRAIEILDPAHREHYDGMDEVNEACRMGMKALERTRWIPCSERLPEAGEEVLVFSRSRGIAVDYYDRCLFGYADVTHWMPLPEPSEEENKNAAD